MEDEVDRLDDPDTTVFNEDLSIYVKQQMNYEFPVERIRKLKGCYTTLISYYVDHRLNMYIRSQYMFEDLAESIYADFMDWTERDFKRVDTSLLRNLRDHMAFNGIKVERKARLAISRAISDCLRDPDNIPISEDRTTLFCEIRPRSASRRLTEHRHAIERTTSDPPGSQVRGSVSEPRVPSEPRVETTDNSTRMRQVRLTDVAKCITREMKYSGLPDEDFDEKVAHFKAALELSRVEEEHDKVISIPFFLQGQAASTYRTQIKPTGKSLEQSLDILKSIFLSEEARRANDNIWDALSIEYVKQEFSTTGMRDTLRRLFAEIERLRNCTSHAAKADEVALTYITRAKLLSAVSGVACFQHVRANPPGEYLRLRGALYDAATQYDTGATKKVKNKLSSAVQPEVFYTDRRFRKKNDHNLKNRPNGSKKRYAGKDQNCWVCGKHGCHSSNHDKNERKQRRTQFRSYLTEALDSSADEKGEAESDSEASSSDSDSEASAFATILSLNSYIQKMGADPKELPDFFGVALDTCCTKFCTASLMQYKAYCRYTGQSPEVHKSSLNFNTSGGPIKSKGYAWVYLPFGRLKELLRVKMHLFDLPSSAPMLLSYDVMKDNNWDMVISAKRLQSSKNSDNFVEYKELDGLPVYKWAASMNSVLRHQNTAVSLYTIQELRNIHRRTGHPSSTRLMKILERSPRVSDLRPDTRAMLKRIGNSCKACQIMAKPPERFRFVLHDETLFNHELLIDIFKLSDGNVLHIMCSGTKYQLGKFIDEATAKSCWNTIRLAWIDVLSGAPDIIRADAGRQFSSKEFKDSASAMGIHVSIVPTEAHNKIGLIERYHKIVRTIYEKLKIDTSDMSRESRLSMTFRCVNDTAGYDGIVPTLLVFGTYPKITIDQTESPGTTAQRAKAIRSASKLATEMITEERLRRSRKDGPSANVLRIDQ
eukprot:IDg23596t1